MKRTDLDPHRIQAIEALRAAAQAYRDMAGESATHGDIYSVHRYVTRALAHEAEARRLESNMS